MDFLNHHLKLLPINELLIYERFDPYRVKKLSGKILSSGKFINPISTVKVPGKKDLLLLMESIDYRP